MFSDAGSFGGLLFALSLLCLCSVFALYRLAFFVIADFDIAGVALCNCLIYSALGRVIRVHPTA